jgi:outer membrane lipopolysaccharide assembly protein LptE/RlpB
MNHYMRKSIWILAGLVLLVSGCGYRLEGGGYIHPGVSRVGVEMFENKSGQTRAGIDFTNELIQKIQEITDTQVVDPDKATRRIKGVIKAITFSTLSRSSTQTVTERRVRAVVDVQLVDQDSKVLWSVSNFSATESYFVAADTIEDDANMYEAIRVISERVADRIISQMSADF